MKINLTGWGARHTFSALAFFSLLVNFTLRVNISVAIVAMVSSGLIPKLTLNCQEQLPIRDLKYILLEKKLFLERPQKLL